MKKEKQNSYDLDLINLDETVGWDILEVEEQLEYFDEEDEYKDPVTSASMTEDEVISEEEYLSEELLAPASVTKKTSGKVKKKKQPETVGEKILAMFRNMTALDGVLAVTSVLVLVVAIITVSVFSGVKRAEQQMAAFAPIGEEMGFLVDTGKGTLLAMADSQKWIEDEEEPTFEYDEKDLELAAVNVNMKLTSVQKDLKIKFVNYKTGKLIPNVRFMVSIKDAEGVTAEYKDEDMDGIIYIKTMTPGEATVTMQAMSGENGMGFNTAPQKIKIKDKIEYKKIDVSEEVKSESEVNAAVEDTDGDTVVEGSLTDTVEWVESSKTEIGVKDKYEKVDRSTIGEPSATAKASFDNATQLLTQEEGIRTVEIKDEESEVSGNEPKTEDVKTEETTEESSEEEEPETESKPSETQKPSETEKGENPKKDKVTPLKDKSGNQMYLQKSDGSYVEAKYADYYNDKAVFYKKTQVTEYKYTGWQEFDGKTYFYDKNGNFVTGEQVIQGAKYNFASDGVLITGSGTMGIDVSKWNGTIDWNAVKNSGVSYVIIRCGYRGSTTGALIEDPVFKSNIKGATAAGLKVGVYFFSQAMNEVEAVEEASMTIGLIKNYRISYPVFLDVEPSGGRADKIDRDTRTKVIKAYCETIKNSGYTPGVYANKTWLESYINTGEINCYKIWLAQYNTEPTYTGKVDLWQYTSKGKVAGIKGDTDLNLSYLGY